MVRDPDHCGVHFSHLKWWPRRRLRRVVRVRLQQTSCGMVADTVIGSTHIGTAKVDKPDSSVNGRVRQPAHQAP
jgi:hypothetical protein